MIARASSEAHPFSMGPQKQNRYVAVVDDDDLMRTAMQGLLKSVGLTARAYASGEEFLDSGHQYQTSCLISDIRMPGSTNGLDLARWVRAHKPATQIILTSGYIDEATEAANVDHHETVLKKPYRCFDLLRRIQSLVGVAGQV